MRAAVSKRPNQNCYCLFTMENRPFLDLYLTCWCSLFHSNHADKVVSLSYHYEDMLAFTFWGPNSSVNQLLSPWQHVSCLHCLSKVVCVLVLKEKGTMILTDRGLFVNLFNLNHVNACSVWSLSIFSGYSLISDLNLVLEIY